MSLENLSDLYWCHPPQAGHGSGSDSWYWTAARELIRIQCLARGPFSRAGGGLSDGETLEPRSSSWRTDSFVAAGVECAVHSICFHGNVSWETVGPEFAAGRLFKKVLTLTVRCNVCCLFSVMFSLKHFQFLSFIRRFWTRLQDICEPDTKIIDS